MNQCTVKHEQVTIEISHGFVNLVTYQHLFTYKLLGPAEPLELNLRMYHQNFMSDDRPVYYVKIKILQIFETN